MARTFKIGTGGDDTITGTSGTDMVLGDAGNDTIQTGEGRDLIRGGGGNDNLQGGGDGDVIRGGTGDDTVEGGTGNDVLLGDAGADIIRGGEGDDHIMGGTGDDTLTGGAGEDVFIFVENFILIENSGNDTITDFDVDDDLIDLSMVQTAIHFDDLTITDLPDNSGVTITHSALGGTLTLTGVSASELTADHFQLPAAPPATSYDTGEGIGIKRATDPEEGTENADFLLTDSGNDTILAKGGNDVILAGEGADKISGGAGNDMLFGEEGDDIIRGDAGDDWLYGGSGDDVFIYKAGHGNDTIADFTDGDDQIRIDTDGLTGVTGFSDLTITNDNGAAVIDLTSQGGGTIRLENVNVSDLDADDFTFYDSSTEPDGF